MSKREQWFTIGGAGVALALVVAIWMWTGQTEQQAPSAPSVDRPAPDFTLPALDGGEVRLEDFRGKVVMVNFWGTWCDPCVREIPALQTAYEELQDDGFVVIGVNLFDDEQGYKHTEEDIRLFVEQQGITYPVALDVEGTVTNAYRVFPIPTSFFVDPEGHIRYVLPRELTVEEITAWFTELKQETTARRQ